MVPVDEKKKATTVKRGRTDGKDSGPRDENRGLNERSSQTVKRSVEIVHQLQETVKKTAELTTRTEANIRDMEDEDREQSKRRRGKKGKGQ